MAAKKESVSRTIISTRRGVILRNCSSTGIPGSSRPAINRMLPSSRDPELSRRLPANEDIASIRRQEFFATVYLVESEEGEIEIAILPIHGYGLWSTLRLILP